VRRESEHPIQSTFGFCPLASDTKNARSFSKVSVTNRRFPWRRALIMAGLPELR
jgi:hypothetical protein